MNKPQPYKRQVFSTCKKFPGSSDNKIHRLHNSASRYLKLCLILAVEERHHTDIQRACRQRRGVYTFPPSHLPPKSSSGGSTPEKHVLFSQLTQILAFPDPPEYDLFYWGGGGCGRTEKRWQFQRCVHLPM